MVQRIGTADSARPHPDPSGGQAPTLHFLIPPSTIGLQIGTFRRWRAGIKVDWRARFRTNGVRGDSNGRARFRTNDECEGIPTDRHDELRGRNDEFGGGNHSSRIGVRDMLSYQAQSFRLATISSMAARMVRVLSRDSGSS